ncbi:MAG TPA: CPBP family glutamic-type intramembrane protease [Oligoflexus sp.]|uniref:CPBP family glutamic-type intramembrane protease n=1 Tax=Oligoflexus sp. TaxID=1971216 RepID=UPI002D5E3ADC|nr:CPBP family glutamic-type intramembrane protease [Oligoflexus sp.]HYX33433.1 CPBP family glutamic-type intramembrane protease [Oligoflexus sp.]
MLESRLVTGLVLWIFLWMIGFSLNALMLRGGMALHGSYQTSVMLGLRDLLLLGISLVVWRRWFPTRWAEQNWRLSHLDKIFALIALLVTVLYYQRLGVIGEQNSPSVMILQQLQYRTPPRIVTLISFQQILTTYFLLDLVRERWGDRQGIVIAALIFAFSHVFGVLIDNPPIFALTVTLGSFVGLMFWGTARVRWRSPWTPFFTHYLFYLGALLGKAWGWL